jgi:hypothetical protein
MSVQPEGSLSTPSPGYPSLSGRCTLTLQNETATPDPGFCPDCGWEYVSCPSAQRPLYTASSQLSLLRCHLWGWAYLVGGSLGDGIRVQGLGAEVEQKGWVWSGLKQDSWAEKSDLIFYGSWILGGK